MKISQFLGEILSDKGMCKMKLNLKEKKLFQGVEETYAKQKGQHVQRSWDRNEAREAGKYEPSGE